MPDDIPSIFISYRRHDPSAPSSPIEDWFVTRYGPANVFRDATSLSGGEEFPIKIQDRIENSDVFLAIIGEHWCRHTSSEPKSLLLNPDDWVRRELETARTNAVPIIPVCYANAPFPKEDDIPASLHFLLPIQAFHFNQDEKFSREMERLDGDIQKRIREAHYEEPSGREPTEEHFRTFLTDFLTTSAEAIGPLAIREGFVDLYRQRYAELRDLALAPNTITLFEARRGIGKSYLLKRLFDEAKSKARIDSCFVYHAWTDSPSESLDPADLMARLASQLIWGITGKGERFQPTLDAAFEGHWNLFRDLIAIYAARPSIQMDQARDDLMAGRIESERSTVASFMLRARHVDHQFSQLRRLLTSNGVHRLFLFIDDFTENVPFRAAHDQFFRLLRQMKTALNPEIGCTIVAGIYPHVTSLSFFRSGQDGQVVPLEFDGTWLQWHKRVAETLIHKQFQVFCVQQNLLPVTDARCTELRNQLFDGNAIKRLSFISNRSPRQYITLLQNTVAGWEPKKKIDHLRLKEVADDFADREYSSIRDACDRFGVLDVKAPVAQKAYQGVRDWIRYGIRQRNAESGRPTLTIRANRTRNQGIENALRLLSYLGLIRMREMDDYIDLELSPLLGIPDFISEAELEKAQEPFSIGDGLIFDGPSRSEPEHASKQQTQKPDSPGRFINLSDLLRKRLSDRYFGTDGEALKRHGLHRCTVDDVAVFVQARQCFRARHLIRTSGQAIPVAQRKMLEAVLDRYLEENDFKVIDDSDRIPSEELLATAIGHLHLPSKIRAKLRRVDIEFVRDLVASREGGTYYQYHPGNALKAGLSEEERARVSKAVTEFLQDYNLRNSLKDPLSQSN